MMIRIIFCAYLCLLTSSLYGAAAPDTDKPIIRYTREEILALHTDWRKRIELPADLAAIANIPTPPATPTAAAHQLKKHPACTSGEGWQPVPAGRKYGQTKKSKK